MGLIGSLARNHPVAFVFTSAATWSVLLLVLMGVASSALRMPFGDAAIGALGILMLARAGPDRVLCGHPQFGRPAAALRYVFLPG